MDRGFFYFLSVFWVYYDLMAAASFPEHDRLLNLVANSEGFFRTKTLGTVKIPASGGREETQFPIYSLSLGSEDTQAPVLGLFGGVHGLERIGTQLLLSFFESLVEQARWDRELMRRFEGIRVVSIPLVNPGGMYLGRRSNPNGIDLNRNAPVEASEKPIWLLGGHRWSPRLPYFRGQVDAGLELESQALVDFVREEIFPSKAALVLDVHSGIGARDRIWFPFAKTTEQFPRFMEVDRIRGLLDRSFPNHVYSVEAQSLSYTTHGDLWDYLFDEHAKLFAGENIPPFIPFTLEMGSWIWVRKNPAQLFSLLGIFNPIKEHRYRRTMRRHLPLLDFFMRLAKNHESWAQRENP